MGYLTRCVLSWEINRRCEDYLSRRRLLALNAPRFVQNSRLEFATTGGRESADPSARTAFHAEIESHVLDLGSKLVFCSAQSLLKATQQLVLLAFGKR